MDKWVIKDGIKRGKTKFLEGDEVIVFRRKNNGHPRALKDNEAYIIIKIENDSLIVAQHSSDAVGFLEPIKVHKTYMISKRYLREIKINSILEQTK